MYVKYFISFFIVVSLFVKVDPLAFTSYATEQQATIMADNLNVRSGPGIEFEPIAQVHTGESYTIIQLAGEWAEIEYNGHTAWVAREYILMDEVEQIEAMPYRQLEKGTTIKISHNNTHIRKKPASDSNITHFATKGDAYEIVDIQDEWLHVKNNNVNGYIKEDLLNTTLIPAIKPLKDKIVVIDVGHGGYDVGAIGVQGTYEKELTLRIAKGLQSQLTKLGVTSYLTRTKDTYVSLSSRASLANTINADAFISIHYNSFPDSPHVEGISTYYYDEHHQKLAKNIQYGLTTKTVVKDRGVEFGDFQVLRQNNRPSALLELGFISNPQLEHLLTETPHEQKLIEGIVHGFTIYFTQKEQM
ncbi:N-acetylmuramoyl-L-alanine amidase [Virgibacillus sp. W0430]|uniref:N-acetylmuramoyl-L-alanine amidase n=1 Tax=Virgibacillus sp. W0430 TaxID=3391580 RepID=UPI003F479983